MTGLHSCALISVTEVHTGLAVPHYHCWQSDSIWCAPRGGSRRSLGNRRDDGLYAVKHQPQRYHGTTVTARVHMHRLPACGQNACALLLLHLIRLCALWALHPSSAGTFVSCRLRHGVLGTDSSLAVLTGKGPACCLPPECCLFAACCASYTLPCISPWHNSTDKCIVAAISILCFRLVAVTPSGFVTEGNKPHVTRPVYKGFSPSPWGHKHMTDQQITL